MKQIFSACQPVPSESKTILMETPQWCGTGIAIALAMFLTADVAASGISERSKTAPEVIQNDGVNGPEGMLWVPGGEFLMGSDHKLAQQNERPAHRVR